MIDFFKKKAYFLFTVVTFIVFFIDLQYRKVVPFDLNSFRGNIIMLFNAFLLVFESKYIGSVNSQNFNAIGHLSIRSLVSFLFFLSVGLLVDNFISYLILSPLLTFVLLDIRILFGLVQYLEVIKNEWKSTIFWQNYWFTVVFRTVILSVVEFFSMERGIFNFFEYIVTIR